MKRQEVLNEMEEMLGVVPSFFGSVTDESLMLEWELFKRMEFGEGAIPAKYRELIGLAVASATGRRQSIMFHNELAKLRGATDEEIEDAVHFAMSSTGMAVYIEGMQIDFETHRNEVLKSVKSREGKPVKEWQIDMSAPREQIYSQIEGALGVVPTPFKKMSDAVLAVEWQLNQLLWFSEGPVPIKYRQLIGVGVGAALRSRNSIFLHTELAKQFGANDAEVEEAVYFAKLTASWSTYIAARQADFGTFRDEILKGVEFARSRVEITV